LHLTNLHVARFRNIVSADLTLAPGINLLVGENGAGKTALLEAIFMLSRGRSFRSSQTNLLVQRGTEDLVVRGNVVQGGQAQVLARQKSATGPNYARIDGENVSLQSKFAELLPLQTLLPGVSDLVLDGPGIRREFMDWGLFHVEQRYLSAARRYRRALSQRAAWLKTSPGQPFQSDPWVGALVDAGVSIAQWREAFVAQLNGILKETLGALDSSLVCDLAYAGGQFGVSEDQALASLEAVFEKDRRFGTTQIGPHRADMEIRVEGVAAKNVVSRGQAKLLASALVLSYATVLIQKTGRRPLLLLDDLGAELDQEHRAGFFAQLRGMGCQVIATTTEAPAHLAGSVGIEDLQVFHVEQGRFTQQ
jgi:DNA replication and repair protein RecF